MPPVGFSQCPTPPWHLAVDVLPVVGLSRGLEQLPGAALVEGDDGAHVLLAEGAVDQRGDVDAPHAFHAVEISEGLVGKVPEGSGKWEWNPSP